jgi:hypothetical protein
LVRAFESEVAGQTESDPVVLDSDGDGKSDASELLAGTDRFDSSDYFRLTAIEVKGGSVLLGLPTVEGRIYEIEFSQSLETGSWEVIDRVTGDGSVVRLDDPDPDRAGLREGYYRVRVTR